MPISQLWLSVDLFELSCGQTWIGQGLREALLRTGSDAGTKCLLATCRRCSMYTWGIRWLHITQVCHGVLCLQCDKTKNEPSYQLWVPKAIPNLWPTTYAHTDTPGSIGSVPCCNLDSNHGCKLLVPSSDSTWSLNITLCRWVAHETWPFSRAIFDCQKVTHEPTKLRERPFKMGCTHLTILYL